MNAFDPAPRTAPGDTRPLYLVRLWKIASVSFIVCLVGFLISFGLCVATLSKNVSDELFGIALAISLAVGALGVLCSIVAAVLEGVWDRRTRHTGRERLLVMLRESGGIIDIPDALAGSGLTLPQLRGVVRRLRREGIVEVRHRRGEDGTDQQMIVLVGAAPK